MKLRTNVLLQATLAFLLFGWGFGHAARNPGKKEWIVWNDSCPIYSTIQNGEQNPVGKLSKDDRFKGFKYVVDSKEVEWIAFKKNGKILYAPFAYLTQIPPENLRDGNLPIGKERVDRWNGLPHDYVPDDLKTLPSLYCYNTFEHQLRAPAHKALIEMCEAAKTENIHLKVVSSYRSAEWQRRQYLHKIETRGLQQRASAKPGHSEHQLGTTVDLAGSGHKAVLIQEFGETPEGKWLKENCRRFGFRISYTKKNQPQTGYIPEPWHVRYIGPPERTTSD